MYQVTFTASTVAVEAVPEKLIIIDYCCCCRYRMYVVCALFPTSEPNLNYDNNFMPACVLHILR